MPRIGLLLLLAITACTRGPVTAPPEKKVIDALAGALLEVPPRGEPSKPGDWLVRVLDAEPDTLNPITATDAYESQINEFIYESLVRRNPKTLEFEPQIAESWESSKDGLSHVFHLRKDVRFHDGHPLTADDIVFSYDRIQDPKVDSPSLKVYFVDVKEFVKLDDYTVKCVYKKPYFRAFEICGASISVLPKHVFEKGDFNGHPNNRHPIGTGPLRFVRWNTGEVIELEPNPDYYDPARAFRFSKVVFRVITENSVALQVFKEGDIDIAGLSPEQWIRQTGSKRFERRGNKVLYDSRSYSYIGWNLRRPKFQDKRVRQAMTRLIPREEIAQKLYYGMARVVCSDVFYLTDYYDKSLVCQKHDPQKAKELLAEAGWKDTDGDGVLDKNGEPLAFELASTAGNPVAEAMSTIIKEELAKAGVQMNIRMLDWAAFLKKVQDWDFDACMLGWSLSLDPDPYQLWHSSGADQKGSSNHVGYKNKEVDSIIEEYRESFDKQKRIELLKRFQEILYDEEPYTFLFSQKARVAYNKRIVNLHYYPGGTDVQEWYVPAGEEHYVRVAAP